MQTLTDEEAKRFWPIYDAYNTELENFVDGRVALLKAYADDFEQMTDVKASELLNRRFAIQKQRDLPGREVSQAVCDRSFSSPAGPLLSDRTPA